VLSGFNCLRLLIRGHHGRATLAVVVLFVLDRLVLWMEARG
jgi:hypothetical protein